MFIINPILKWSYKDIWDYLKDLDAVMYGTRDYCCLYNNGYTSLGDKLTTNKNILLCQFIKVQNGQPEYKYAPAYFLHNVNPKHERLSRVSTPIPKYIFEGIVSKGKQFARTLGYPTANIQYYLTLNTNLTTYLDCNPNGSIYPAFVALEYHHNGKMCVYRSGKYWDYIGMCYIRSNIIEVNIFDLDLNKYPSLYGKNIHIMIFDKIRDNIECESIENLKECLKEDEKVIKQFFTFFNN